MSEMKTLKFPGDTEPREIVDAKAREDINRLSDEIANIPSSLPNPNALTIKIGSTTVTYDGSTAQTVTIADGTEVSY